MYNALVMVLFLLCLVHHEIKCEESSNDIATAGRELVEQGT